MKLEVSVLVSTLLLLSACGGPDKPAANPGGATASAEAAASCRELSKLLCDKSQGDDRACQEIDGAIGLLPPKSCDEALKDQAYIQARLASRKPICVELMDRLCVDLGQDSRACAMAREQAPKFDRVRCQMMYDRYADVLADLKRFELESQPLGLEDQKAIAAADAPSFGPADAKVTVVVFSDFECPYCSKAAKVVSHLKTNFATQVRLVFRQFPLSFHEHAALAAEASLVAHDAGKFWEYHDELFMNQSALGIDALTGYGKLLGLDPEAMREKLNAHAQSARVKADIALGERVHVSGTPTLFINGRRAQDATSVESVAQEVTEALAE